MNVPTLSFRMSLFILFFTAAQGWSQLSPVDVEQRRERAEQAIRELKDGMLIIRLDSHRKKITALKEAIAREQPGSALRSRLEEDLKITIADKDKWNKALVDAFSNGYTFSEFLVMYDSSTFTLQEGVRSGIFLDENLEVDPDIELTEEVYYILDWEENDRQSAAGQRGLVFSDKDYRKLEPPFPYFTHAEKYAYFLFIPLGEDLGQAEKWVERLMKNLNRAYDRLN
jgi:hypothetical protein